VGCGRALLLNPRRAWAENPTSENFVLIQWQADPPEFDLAIVNLAPHAGQCYAPIDVEGLADHIWVLNDLLGSETHTYRGPDLRDRCLYLDLPANGAQLFRFHPQP
jgi:hypothetical protein